MNEIPKLSPEGTGGGERFESADVDIEALSEYLRTTAFESEESIKDLLIGQYKMHPRKSITQIELGMTRIIPTRKRLEEKAQRGERITKEDEMGIPLSGREPRAVARLTLKTLDGNVFDLRIFEVFNRNQRFRYEYILNKIAQAQEK